MADDFAADGIWQTRSTGPAVPVTIGSRPEDFRVDEIDLYPASGSGEHLLVRIEKRGLSTPEAVHRIAAVTSVNEREIGFAGRKDARALSTQRLSMPRNAEPHLKQVEDDSLKILEATAHNKKFRLGHLAGNRFALTLSPVPPEHQPLVVERAREITCGFMPNYFGNQRLGKDLHNAAEGLAMLARGRSRGSRRNADFLISAVQSMLFNDLVALRLRRDLFMRVVDGDLLKTQRGGLFTCTDVTTDSARLAQREITITGPMFGGKMMTTIGTALTLESEILAARQLEGAQFLSFRPTIPGTRRPIQVALDALTVDFDPTATRLGFSLPAGSYATVLVRELFRVVAE